MLPSMAVSTMNPTAGLLVRMGSSAGNAYAQALSEGYTKEQAAAYGVMVGTLEGLLSKALGSVYVDASRRVINGKTKAEQRKEISEFFGRLLEGNSSLDIQTIEGDVLTITKNETAKKARDDYKTVNRQQIKMSDDEFAVKLHIESHIDEIAEVSKPRGSQSDNKNHSFAKDGFTYRRAYFRDFDGQYYEVTLSIGNNGTVATVYNVGKIKESVSPSAKVIAVVGSKPLGEAPSNNKISPSAENVNTVSSLSEVMETRKAKQLDIILENNPANNTYSTWIRDVSDIKTFEETLQDSDWSGWEESGFDPDYTPDMVKESLSSGKITVYSSYPIEQGVFVTPSRMEAQNYSANGKVYSKTVDLKDVAWIDPTQGQYAKVLEDTYRETKNTAQDSGVRYSITESFTDSYGNHYENAVLLDTDFFDGISPRNWGERLRDEVNKRAADNPFILPISDEGGDIVLLQFANPKDRITKDGASNHKVLDKLSSSSDNISKLAVIHIDEIVSVSEKNTPYFTNENNHQWLDQNGWLHRNANVINQKNGNIYNLTVDLAKTADGRTILYATDGKIKKVGNVQVNSLKIKGSGQNSNFNDSVSEKFENVNRGSSSNDIKTSLGEDLAPVGNYSVYGKDIALETAAQEADEDIAPLQERYAAKTQQAIDGRRTPAPVVNWDDITSEADRQTEAEGAVEHKTTRKELHSGILESIKTKFSEKGFDFDEVLRKAKNLSTFSTVDNTPQRVMEKALGYKQGQILSDITVNQVAQNETEGIKWHNGKISEIKQISKQYGIKPGSKESAAAQMYAEGFYVDKNKAIIKYGDLELAKDFPNAKVRNNIKSLARDPRIRQIYDETLSAINESRTRNAYPEIPKLDNYFLHFRAMEDTFSRLGLPFNPNDIKAKDLPTDLNGVTADLKPGQPYFASSLHRTGKRTSFDLLGGLERYLTSAKNQIYHIDDIQTLRALRNYIADTYGQANGLEGLDVLSEEEAQERIEKVYGAHLSTFAKFLNEEANILAGKTALIDRGLEGIIGRRGITFLNTINGQVGSNMVGMNISSSLTNFLPIGSDGTISWEREDK